MDFKRSILSLLLLFYISSSLLLFTSNPSPMNNVLKEIEANYRKLVSFNTRFTGYPEYYEAVEYVSNYFKSLGLKVILQPFKVVIPYDNGSYILNLNTGEKVKVYALLPNLVQTSSGAYSGKIIYLTNLREISPSEVKGNIILIDYNSRKLWLELASMGAKAVIFLEPSKTYFRESLTKFVPVPLKFPRAYVTQKDSQKLITWSRRGDKVKLVIKMAFKEVTAYNIIGVLEGKNNREIIAVSSHLDSWSPVPAKAPGVDSAISTSVLLTLAKHFAQSKDCLLYTSPSPRDRG